MSLIDDTISAVVTRLTTAPAVAAQVDRVRLRPLAKSVSAAIVVRPIRSNANTEMLAGGVIAWDTTVSVECYARAAAGTSADESVDTLLAATYARLMDDTTLGGVVQSITPISVELDFDADEQAAACATLAFSVRSVTAAATF